MFTRILVPLDGSARAESAIPVAARIAQASGGSVILLRVASSPIDTGKFSTTSASVEEYADADLAESTRYLEKIAESDELSGTTTEIKTFVGAIAPTILSATQTVHADMILMCSHGYTGFKRWALGSVADKVTRYSPVPVLVLRDGGSVPITSTQRPLRAVVPLDGSPLSESALEPGAQLVTALAPSTQKAIHVMRVVDIPSSYGKFRSSVDENYDAGIRAEAKHEYGAYLDSIAQRFSEGDLATYNLSVTTSVPIDMDVAEAIVQAAEHDLSGYDLIVMATHGRGGVQRWVLGSVAERVLHTTKTPLLIVRAAHVKDDDHEETRTVVHQSHLGV